MAALFVYIFGTYFSSSFIGIFVSVTLLLSLDFWTVKNVTGRIMVRMQLLEHMKFIQTTLAPSYLWMHIVWNYQHLKV